VWGGKRKAGILLKELTGQGQGRRRGGKGGGGRGRRSPEGVEQSLIKDDGRSKQGQAFTWESRNNGGRAGGAGEQRDHLEMGRLPHDRRKARVSVEGDVAQEFAPVESLSLFRRLLLGRTPSSFSRVEFKSLTSYFIPLRKLK